jgi:hypothetical protein
MDMYKYNGTGTWSQRKDAEQIWQAIAVAEDYAESFRGSLEFQFELESKLSELLGTGGTFEAALAHVHRQLFS